MVYFWKFLCNCLVNREEEALFGCREIVRESMDGQEREEEERSGDEERREKGEEFEEIRREENDV